MKDAKPLKIIPLAFIEQPPKRRRHLMVLSSRTWKPERGWCRHGWRTWIMPLLKDPTKGQRFHGQAEDFGVLIEVWPRCLPTDAPRLSRRPERERRWEKAS